MKPLVQPTVFHVHRVIIASSVILDFTYQEVLASRAQLDVQIAHHQHVPRVFLATTLLTMGVQNALTLAVLLAPQPTLAPSVI